MRQLLIIWSAVCSLLQPQAAEGAKPHLYMFELSDTSLQVTASLTQADLDSLVPSGVKDWEPSYQDLWQYHLSTYCSMHGPQACRIDVKIVACF